MRHCRLISYSPSGTQTKTCAYQSKAEGPKRKGHFRRETVEDYGVDAIDSQGETSSRIKRVPKRLSIEVCKSSQAKDREARDLFFS